MKEYILACKVALDAKLLRLLEDRQHFVDNPDYYSIQVSISATAIITKMLVQYRLIFLWQDLIDVSNKELVSYLEPIHQQFIQHIAVDCAVITCVFVVVGFGRHCLNGHFVKSLGMSGQGTRMPIMRSTSSAVSFREFCRYLQGLQQCFP